MKRGGVGARGSAHGQKSGWRRSPVRFATEEESAKQENGEKRERTNVSLVDGSYDGARDRSESILEQNGIGRW